MWARVHKIDRIRPLPGGGASILVEDERTVAQVHWALAMSTLIAIARVLDARQVLDAKYAGKGEVRYVAPAGVASSFMEAVARAGAHVVERERERVAMAAQPGSLDALVDTLFSELAQHTKVHLGAADLAAALQQLEAARAKTPLDREAAPQLYWPAVFELAAVAGALSRRRKARWVEVREMPVPFALRFPDSPALARPFAVAQKIVEGQPAAAASAAEVIAPAAPAAPES